MKKAWKLVIIGMLCLLMLPVNALALELPALDVLEATGSAVEEAAAVVEELDTEAQEKSAVVESAEEAGILYSGDETPYAMVDNYDDLVAALANVIYQYITICPVSYSTNEPFSWPEGEVTLKLEAANASCSIGVGNGTWNIPENVTVNAYDSVYLAAPDSGVTVDGTWNVMNGSGGFSGQYGTVIVNGTMNIAEDVRGSVAGGSFVLNGTVNNAGTWYVYSEMILADGAQVVNVPKAGIKNSMREIYITSSGSITGPAEGSASIGGQITVNVDSALRGNLTVEKLYIHDVTLTVSEGADITVGDITSNPYERNTTNLVVDGTLNLAADSYCQVNNTVVTLGENGVFRIAPYVQFGSSESNSSFTGTGTLELEGEMRERDDGYMYCYMAPQVFGQNSLRMMGYEVYEPLPNVADSVTVVRLWDPDGVEGDAGDSGDTDDGDDGDDSGDNGGDDDYEAYADYIQDWLNREMENGSPIYKDPDLAAQLVNLAASGDHEVLEATTQELKADGLLFTVPMTFDEFTGANGDNGGTDISVSGNVNGDETVDTADLVLLMKNLVGVEGAEFAEDAGDVNGDGGIDILDVIALVRYLAE